MKPLLNMTAICLIAASTLAGDSTTNNGPASVQEEQLFQRFQNEMRQKMQALPPDLSSNFSSPANRVRLHSLFESVIIDPSFGLDWDEVPAPTMTNASALSAVNSFVASNGWNMQTNDDIFDSISDADDTISKPIRGLPWTVIHEKEFPAVTHDGILYVFFRGFHHDGHGVAYNPETNHFASSIDSFKPIGQHWYVWIFDHEFPPEGKEAKEYEGPGLKGTKPAGN